MISDNDNDAVFGFNTVPAVEIAGVISKLSDPAKVVLNCLLMSEGIDSREKVAGYLDFAAEMGVRNVSFIGMSRHNEYCRVHYINPTGLNLSEDSRFHIWNQYHDHDYCRCCSGNYDAANGSVRFYCRCIGVQKAPYARQIVYTADNRLLAGFSGQEIRFDGLS
jgi:hypothetical protein